MLTKIGFFCEKSRFSLKENKEILKSAKKLQIFDRMHKKVNN